MLKREDWHLTYRWARRIAVSIVGGTVLMLGIAMLVLPGPGLIVIPVGLAILGAEFAWARRWLRKVKARTAYVVDRVRNNGFVNGRKNGTAGSATAGHDADGTRDPQSPPRS